MLDRSDGSTDQLRLRSVPNLQAILAPNLSIPWNLSSLQASVDLAITAIRNLQRNIAGVLARVALLPDSHDAASILERCVLTTQLYCRLPSMAQYGEPSQTSLGYFGGQGIEVPEEQLLSHSIKSDIQIQIHVY